METVSKVLARGKFYSESYWDSVEATMKPDGTAQLNIKFIQVTNKGEAVMGMGIGVHQPSNP